MVVDHCILDNITELSNALFNKLMHISYDDIDIFNSVQ